MNRSAATQRVAVDASRSHRIVGAAGATVFCAEGHLWLTRDGCPRDIVLAPGQSWRTDGPQPVIVSGLGPSTAWILPAERAHDHARRAAVRPIAWPRLFGAYRRAAA